MIKIFYCVVDELEEQICNWLYESEKECGEAVHIINVDQIIDDKKRDTNGHPYIVCSILYEIDDSIMVGDN